MPSMRNIHPPHTPPTPCEHTPTVYIVKKKELERLLCHTEDCTVSYAANLVAAAKAKTTTRPDSWAAFFSQPPHPVPVAATGAVTIGTPPSPTYGHSDASLSSSSDVLSLDDYLPYEGNHGYLGENEESFSLPNTDTAPQDTGGVKECLAQQQAMSTRPVVFDLVVPDTKGRLRKRGLPLLSSFDQDMRTLQHSCFQYKNIKVSIVSTGQIEELSGRRRDVRTPKKARKPTAARQS